MPNPLLFAWIGLLAIGLIALIVGSHRAIEHAQALVFGTRIPPFFIGITFVAVGTDLPEIANSIAASVAGHGDINMGDSVGSVATQATLVLGLLPWLAGSMSVGRKRVLVVTGLCAAALVLGGFFVSDGFLGRGDATMLILAWLVGSLVILKATGPLAEPALPVAARRSAYHALSLLGALVLVTAGATAAVSAFARLSEMAGVPEYILTFFLASIGTSLPELFVDVAALRRGLRDLALGDILGSNFVDATLSLGIGPLIAPTVVSGALGVRGAAATTGAILVGGALLAMRRKHDRLSGTLLLGVYAGLYLALLS